MYIVNMPDRQKGGEITNKRSMYPDSVVNNAMFQDKKPWSVPRFISLGYDIIDISLTLYWEQTCLEMM